MRVVFLIFLFFFDASSAMDYVTSTNNQKKNKKVHFADTEQNYTEALQATYFSLFTEITLAHLKRFFDKARLNEQFYQKIKERNEEMSRFLRALGANSNGFLPSESLSVSTKKRILIPCWQKAIHHNDLEQLKQLKFYGFNPNARNEQNLTPLMLAAIYNNPAMTQFLLANDADPTLEEPQGKTAYALAKRVNSQQVLKLLPADIKKQPESDDDSGCCALY